ncbi:MAG: segregation/condensation protein A [Acidobacteriota bacterium]
MTNGDDRLDEQQAESGEASIRIRLDCFEGPLDLLLHLIKKDELDIWNIPVARVTEQYLEYLQLMRDLNINLAGEWLVMAATLIYIKSQMLLPPEPAGAEDQAEPDDPRTELVYQLLEHQKFKNAAQMLYTREEVENSVWSRPPAETLEEGREAVSATLFDLLRAFHEVVKRFEEQSRMEMYQEEVSIEQKIEDIRHLLLVHNGLLFSHFFRDAASKQHLIATFLALLELVRTGEILIFQKLAFEDIRITRSGPRTA